MDTHDSAPARLAGAAPAVSVLLSCCNQERFVAEAVAGILAQDLQAPFEVVVADDGSTDRTREIAADRLRGRPGMTVTLLPARPNVGATRNFFEGMDACRAPFIAVLEGDDYWTFSGKLSAQRSLLLRHPDWAVCANNIMIHDAANGTSVPRAPPGDAVTLCGPDDLVADNLPGNMSASMYRRSTLARLPAAVRQARCGDWLLNICAAASGPLAFMHQPMSVYRKHAAGVWNGLERTAQLELLLELLPEYDLVTQGRHRLPFARIAASTRQELEALRACAAP